MRVSKAKAKSGGAVPWWLSEESETCFACNHLHAHRTEIYCFDCDGPVCPICIEQTTTLELICPGCLNSRSREEES